jgi:hypothetical protein
VGRECRIRVVRVGGGKVRYEENAADLAFASDVARECRSSVGQRWRECRIRVVRVGGGKVRYEENAADLAFASDVARECRSSVGQRCGERMQN